MEEQNLNINDYGSLPNYENLPDIPARITAHESVGLPAPECLMVKELVPAGLEGIHGEVCYSDYECLR